MEPLDVPTYRLLQPELMTADELIQVLRRYKLTLDVGTRTDELLEIYRRVALPLPQRTYGSTWRERLLAKKRNRRKIAINESSEANAATKSTEHVNPAPPNDLPTKTHRSRLKPPLNSTGSKRQKIIKLSSSPTNKSNDGSKELADSATSPESSSNTGEDESTICQSKHKRIKIDFSDNSERSTPLPKVVWAKRLSEEGSNEPSSKHRRIVI